MFEILLEHPDGMSAREVLARLRERISPTPFEGSQYPNRPGVVRYEKIVRFATIAFVKAGWLAKARGTWSVTDEGREAYLAVPGPRGVQAGR